MIAFVTILYGALLGGGGLLAWRRIRSLPSLLGGTVLGGLAIAGGLLLLGGGEIGRGLALLAAVLATLFFGWSLSGALRSEEPRVIRPAALFAVSLVEAALLVATR
jgi:uncharacterized membrane protein (UPF0136 family)